MPVYNVIINIRRLVWWQIILGWRCPFFGLRTSVRDLWFPLLFPPEGGAVTGPIERSFLILDIL